MVQGYTLENVTVVAEQGSIEETVDGVKEKVEQKEDIAKNVLGQGNSRVHVTGVKEALFRKSVTDAMEQATIMQFLNAIVVGVLAMLITILRTQDVLVDIKEVEREGYNLMDAAKRPLMTVILKTVAEDIRNGKHLAVPVVWVVLLHYFLQHWS